MHGLEQDTAVHLSSVAEIVADRLSAARNARSFVKALEANHQFWQSLSRASLALGWPVPESEARFALSLADRPEHSVSDHDVEMLISINRRLARELASR